MHNCGQSEFIEQFLPSINQLITLDFAVMLFLWDGPDTGVLREGQFEEAVELMALCLHIPQHRTFGRKEECCLQRQSFFLDAPLPSQTRMAIPWVAAK